LNACRPAALSSVRKGMSTACVTLFSCAAFVAAVPRLGPGTLGGRSVPRILSAQNLPGAQAQSHAVLTERART
jgi:hypothetical protein